jgi:thiamine-monophosphate kinase
MKVKDIGELALISRIAGKIRTDKSVVKGIGDDTAVIKWTKGKYLLFTCDMTVEDVHFKLSGARPEQIGRKALARNISDIAAMGGIPRYAVVSIGLRPDLPVSVTDRISRSIVDLAKRYKINIVGGDTVKSKKIVVDISLLGEVEKKNLILRSGAKRGDLVFVTGAIGGSRKSRHLDFEPRLNEARKLVTRFKINSMIDISDGLLLDAWRIADASGVGIRLYEKLVPLSKGAGPFEKAVKEGEDFELLFTMSPKEAIRASKVKFKIPISLIGQITDRREDFKIVDISGKEKQIKPKGFLHF